MAEKNRDKDKNKKKNPLQPPKRQRPEGNQKKPGFPPEGPQWKRASRTLFFWVIIITVALYLSQYFSSQRQAEEVLSYDEFITSLESGNIKTILVENRTLYASREEMVSNRFNKKQYGIRVTLPPNMDPDMIDTWRKSYNIKILFKEDSPGIWNYVFGALPWLLLIGFWIYILRRMQGGGGNRGIFAFGKSRAKLWMENQTKVTFQDVAGADEAKEELEEIIEFLKDPDKFQRLGGKIPKGALLLGPPGTGKTLMARAVAGEAGVPFFSISGADFVEMFVGVGASRVRDLFEQGKSHAPCIIFIDEIDAVGRHRGAGLGGGHDEREQTLNQLLVEMDGFSSNEGVILLAATNRPDVLDSALLRPGRFDRQIVVDRPDMRGREGILKVHMRDIPVAKNIDLVVLAQSTPGFSGADLANMVNEAALLAARKNKKCVEMTDFEEAKDKVLMGAERKSLLISEDEKRTTAYHEAGHALVAKLTPGTDPVHKVSIIPRGRALGVTMSLPMTDKHNYTKKYCLAIMRQLLGGRAAEQIALKEMTTGAGDDIKKATELSRKMVCEWGMSEKLGPLTFGDKQDEIFLGREIAQHRDYSEETAQLIDQEVRTIVEEAIRDAEELIKKNTEALHAFANALLERETLDSDQLDMLLNGKKLPPLRTSKKSTAKSTCEGEKKRKSKTKTGNKQKEQSRKASQENKADSE